MSEFSGKEVSTPDLSADTGPGNGFPRILIIACGALAHDLVRVRDLNGWDHLDFQCLPAELHNQPQLIAGKVREKIRQNRDRYQHIYIGYSDCGTGGQLDTLIREEQVERLPGAHCYEMFAGSEKFNQLSSDEIGTFYLTDYLARNFKRLIISGLGIDKHPELKDMYFSNYRKLVFLSQLDDPAIEQYAVEAAELLGLAYEKIQTGDEQLMQSLQVTVNSAKQ